MCSLEGLMVLAVWCTTAAAVIFNGTTFDEEYMCYLKMGAQGVCQPSKLCSTGGVNHDELPDCLIEGASHICCPPAVKTSPDKIAPSNSQLKCKELSKLRGNTGKCPALRPFTGSNEAVAKEFPHLVALGYGGNVSDDPRWYCGGALVSSNYVLTVASCARGSRAIGPPKWVRLGDINLASNEDDTHAQTVTIERIIAHPGSRASSVYNDIALLKLSREVQVNEWVRPACLHTRRIVAARRAVVAGWGTTSWSSGSKSPILRKADLPLIADDECSEMYTQRKVLSQGIDKDSMLCAADPARGKDTCMGDSGTPLQVKLAHPYCTYIIVGLTSFGRIPCGAANSATVFTRVSHFIPWIDSIVWAKA